MQKWNMVIDVAECTNCNLCTLAVMDEYVGNAWPGYSAAMPKHGHKWINILQKERGQVPMIDIAYVPTMCNHCDHAPCMAKAGDAVKKREDGRTWSRRVRTVTSGGTRSCSFRRSGRSTPTSWTRAGNKRAASNRVRPGPCGRSSSRTRTWRASRASRT